MRSSRVIVLLLPAMLLACSSESPARPVEPTSREAEALALAVGEELALDAVLTDDERPTRPLSLVAPEAPNDVVVTPPATALPSSIPWPIPKLLRAWAFTLPQRCLVNSDGTWIAADADDDGVPDSSLVTLSCTSLPGAMPAFELSGDVLLADAGDAVDRGYWMAFGNLRLRTTAVDGTTVTRTLNGNITVVRHADGTGVDVNRDLSLRIERTVAGRSPLTLKATMNGTLGITKETGAATVTSSTRFSLTFDGAYRRWERTTDPTLHWSVACRRAAADGRGYDGGALLYRDDRGNALRVAVRACGVLDITVNDHAL